MSRPAAGLAAALVLAAVLAPAAVAPAAAAGPSVEATVGGTAIDGARVVVTADPSLRIDASADRPIDAVAVRVDGRLVRSFSPNATTVDRTVPLVLDRGDNRVAVSVEAGNRTERLVGTVAKDAVAPRVAFTAPFSSSPLAGPPGMTRVDRPSVRLAGDLIDTAGAAAVTITHTYTYTHAGNRERHRRTYSITDPGASFSRRLFLGLGTNRIRVQVRDRVGYARTYEFDLKMHDSDPPNVQFDRVERVDNGSRVRVAGTVDDDVKVDTVAVTRGYGNAERLLVEPTTREPDPDRRSVRFEATVPVAPRTGRVRIVATDVAGRSAARELPDEFGRPAVPDVRIAGARIEDGRVRVRGTVEGGEIERVVVETTTADGERIGLATVHDGAAVRRVDVDRRLGAAADGPTVVRLRAVDATGTERVASRTVGGPTPTPTPAADRPATDGAAGTPASGSAPSLPGPDSPVLAAGVGAATVTALAGAVVLLFR
ncbi:MAG: hypothetical protein ABEH40_06400 [Haloferacaceae archaeon]